MEQPLGRPYEQELAQLADSYLAATEADVDVLASAICDATMRPLVAVGSGGAFSAAHFACMLHERLARRIARPMTPLQLMYADCLDREHSVMCLSARGSNADIRNAFKTAAIREYRQVFAVCMRTRSPLEDVARSFHCAAVLGFELLAKKDGFLATNSLLTFCLLLARAYHAALGEPLALPRRIDDLAWPGTTRDAFLGRLQNWCAPLWERSTLGVLHGLATETAARDLESKFVEAALGPVQVSDYRNFAHGRHNWFARHGDDSAILAFTTDKDRELARRTLSLVPSDVRRVQIHFPGDLSTSAIAAVVTGLHIVGLAGQAKGVDPGRPSVPHFGRRIYSLRVPSSQWTGKVRPRDLRSAAILRKSSVCPNAGRGRQRAEEWDEAYDAFVRKLERACFSAVVLDYDNTLCAQRERASPLRHSITRELIRLIGTGVALGVATGRGASARTFLREALPKRHWTRVVMGYYNGAECTLLDDDSRPCSSEEPCAELRPVAEALRAMPSISSCARITVRRSQITIEPHLPCSLDALWTLANQTVSAADVPEARLVRSRHSVDVLAPGVSKTALLSALRRIGPQMEAGDVLCVGDLGGWPGNDFELLGTPFSLSVDEVSADPNTCWNLAPPGYKGIQATLAYLRALRKKGRGVRFSIQALKEAIRERSAS